MKSQRKYNFYALVVWWDTLRAQRGIICLKSKYSHPCATRIQQQPSHTETPTHIETRTHDQCGDTIEKSQAPDDGCINVRNMLNIEEVK